MATCEDVTIFITNSTGVEVKATRFQYTDEGRSRDENIFSFGSDTFDPGETKDYGPRNFGKIGNENTEFTVTYQHRSGNSWGPNLVETTGTFNCDDNDDFHITLTD